VAQGQGGHQRVVQRDRVAQVGRRFAGADETRQADIDAALAQLRRLVFGQGLDQVQLHLRIGGAKLADGPRQHGKRGRAGKRDAQPAVAARRQALGLVVQPRRLQQQFLGARIEKPAQRRRLHGAARTVEQLAAQVGFQLPQLHADGRRCHVQALGRVRRAARFYYFTKIPQLS